MPTCNCGCNEETRGGRFAPGHDQALRAQLERRVGGLLVLRELVDLMESFAEGRTSSEALQDRIRQAFNGRDERPRLPRRR